MTDPLKNGDPTRVGPYELCGRLGAGGMGQVFLGRSRGGRLVAVKVVHSDLAKDAQFRRRFAIEVEAAIRVGGFYTAQVVDAAPDGDPAWLATAYIPGLTLHQAVVDHGPLPPESVAVLGAGLAEGLAAVHAEGVVHRDLKPANVILAEDGPRLIDFGIAKALDTMSHTRTRTVLGTAAFMSPEQARAEAVGPSSDVFALGCVLAFAAGGDLFGEGPSHAVAYRIVHESPDLSGLSGGLADLVADCVTKEAGARPEVDEVLERMAAYASSVSAGSEGLWLPNEVTEVVTVKKTKVLGLARTKSDGGSGQRGVQERAPVRESGSIRKSEKGAALTIGNFSTEGLEVTIDGSIAGTVPELGESTFQVSGSTCLLQVRSAEWSSAVQRTEMGQGGSEKIAFGSPAKGGVGLVPVTKVTCQSKMSFGGGIFYLMLSFVFFVLELSVDLDGVLYLLVFLFLLIGCGGIWLDTVGAVPTVSVNENDIIIENVGGVNSRRIRWKDLKQVSVVSNGKDVSLVVWCRKGRPRPPGREFQGGVVVCSGISRPGGAESAAGLLGAGLRWFGGDIYVAQSG